MRTEIVKDKEGKTLQTKDGKTMYNHFFEDGDIFVPQFNSYLESPHEAEVKGKMKTIVERKMVCEVNGVIKDEEGEIIGAKPYLGEEGELPEGENKVYVTLTPTQAKAIDKQKKLGIEPNQVVWKAYSYVNDYGDQVGIGPKVEFKPAISIEDGE